MIEELEMTWTCKGKAMRNGELVEYTHHLTGDELRLSRIDLFKTVEELVKEKLRLRTA